MRGGANRSKRAQGQTATEDGRSARKEGSPRNLNPALPNAGNCKVGCCKGQLARLSARRQWRNGRQHPPRFRRDRSPWHPKRVMSCALRVSGKARSSAMKCGKRAGRAREPTWRRATRAAEPLTYWSSTMPMKVLLCLWWRRKAVPITSMTAARDGDLVEAAPLPPSTGRGLVGPRAGSTVARGHMEMGLDFHWPARATASSGALATTASGLTTRSTNLREKRCLSCYGRLRRVGDLCCLMLNQTNRLLHSTTRQDVECDCRRRDLCRVEKDVNGPLGPGFGEGGGAKLEFLGIGGLVLLRPARHGDNQGCVPCGTHFRGELATGKDFESCEEKGYVTQFLAFNELPPSVVRQAVGAKSLV